MIWSLQSYAPLNNLNIFFTCVYIYTQVMLSIYGTKIIHFLKIGMEFCVIMLSLWSENPQELFLCPGNSHTKMRKGWTPFPLRTAYGLVFALPTDFVCHACRLVKNCNFWKYFRSAYDIPWFLRTAYRPLHTAYGLKAIYCVTKEGVTLMIVTKRSGVFNDKALFVDVFHKQYRNNNGLWVSDNW